MKTFVISLVILTLVIGFIIWNALDLNKTLDEMLTLASSLPIEASDFRKNAETEATVNALQSIWEQKFNRIALTESLGNLNRADEAVLSLSIHYKNDNAEDFTYARLLLLDSLKRLKSFESFYTDSIL